MDGGRSLPALAPGQNVERSSVVRAQRKRGGQIVRTDCLKGNGAPGEIRTPDLLIRSQSLYPAELRAHTRGGFRERTLVRLSGIRQRRNALKRLRAWALAAAEG